MAEASDAPVIKDEPYDKIESKAAASLNGLPDTPASREQEDTDADDDESCYEMDDAITAAPATVGDVHRLMRKVTYVQHQMYRIMLSMNVPPCGCKCCESMHEKQNRLILKTTAEQQFNMTGASNALSNLLQSDANGTSPRGFNSGQPQSPASSSHVPRRARYATDEQRVAIAQFAAAYGATAAARKFGVPASVASYCHRKVFGRALPKGRRPLSDAADADRAMSDAPSLPRRSPPTSGAGRIRGRPRLIGDELDAELVEHLLDLRKEQGRPRWSANTMLQLSTDFIRSRAPGLLAEDGGHVTLKLTWANTMLQRIYQRERGEVEKSPISQLNFPSSGATATVHINGGGQFLNESLSAAMSGDGLMVDEQLDEDDDEEC